MLLSSAPHQSVSAAEKFSAPISGLRSLLAGDGRRGAVVTRAAVVSRSRGGGRCQAVSAKEEDVDEAGIAEDPPEEEEDLDGFWVSYGRRCPRRRLPPPIPSLVARGALRRTRTDDGRLVIRIVPVVRPECIRARRRGDRLTIQLVEHGDDDSPVMAPPLRELPAARGDGVVGIAQVDDNDDGCAAIAAPAVGGGVDDGIEEEAVAARERPDMVLAPAVPPPRVSSAGCFEDVFKYGSIGSSSLRQMPSLRMVH